MRAYCIASSALISSSSLALFFIIPYAMRMCNLCSNSAVIKLHGGVIRLHVFATLVSTVTACMCGLHFPNVGAVSMLFETRKIDTIVSSYRHVRLYSQYCLLRYSVRGMNISLGITYGLVVP